MKQGHVLVVDDEDSMLHSVERVLTSQYRVTVARSPAIALAQAKEEGPDLAIIDIRMPEMDGFELLSALREAGVELDVIFMTGEVQELDSKLIRSIREDAFYFIQKPFDREVLLTLVERCFEQRKLRRENEAYVERLETELQEARSFQLGLLPGDQASIGGLSFAAKYQPCDELGGDFYDFADVGDGRAAFMIADVSGHGVSAAMLTGVVKSAFHDARVDQYEPLAVTRRVVQGVSPFDYGRFVSLFCGRVEPGARRMEYVNAGHPPALLWADPRDRAALELTGPVISPAISDFMWESADLDMGSNKHMLLYTDGITEARGEEGFYGDDRLHQVIENSRAHGHQLLDSILASVKNFASGRPSSDDLTLLTISTSSG